MKKIYLFILSSFLTTTFAFAGGCAPNTTNGSCATAVAITPGAVCINGSTCNGSAPTSSSCVPAGSQCSWHSFVATATSMYVQINVTNAPGCFIASNIYAATGTCVGTEISCLSGTPMNDVHNLTGLSIGATYYIQICEPQFGPCGGDAALYCIDVGIPTPPCNTCSSPCGTAQGFATTPTIPTVTSGCTTTPYNPPLQPSSTNTFCYSFQATNTTVNFNVIITSNCGSGNVTFLNWSLYNSPSCGAAIQTGTLPGLTFSGLVVGNDYVFCYTFGVPSTCTHSQHCPYFVGAIVTPITLSHFDATYNQKTGFVDLDWATLSEINNEFFTVEKSVDGVTFEVVSIMKGAGNSSAFQDYASLDKKPYIGTSYYRLKQTDFDGQFEYFNMVAVNVEKEISDIIIYPNPVSGNGTLTFSTAFAGTTNIVIYDVSGRIVYTQNYAASKGANTISLSTNTLVNGMYFISLSNGSIKENLKFIKE